MRKSDIKRILADMQCLKGLDYTEDNFKQLCKGKKHLDADIVECLAKPPVSCKYLASFPYFSFCRCPLL